MELNRYAFAEDVKLYEGSSFNLEPEIFEEMMAHHRKKGSKSRGGAIKKALRAHNDVSATADKENIADVPQ
ncbi:hypothetical protein Aduo_012689 [Ancylostoma duodenale]